jgi:VWFA-related protein
MKHAASILVVTLLVLARPIGQERTPFRAVADVVTVDVSVISSDGQAIADLTAQDFRIVVGGRPRPLVSSQFIVATDGSRSSNVSPPPQVFAPRIASTNAQPTTGRIFLFVVDVENIRAGEGRVAFQTIRDYLSRFQPTDRIGLVSLPYGTPQVDLTTNRLVVGNAISEVAGASSSDNSNDMSVGEATYIARGDSTVLAEYLKKESVTAAEVWKWQVIAERILDHHRRHARNILRTLRSLADAMAGIEGPKAIVFVSEGLKVDKDTLSDLKEFASSAARARVTLYGFHLELPPVEAAHEATTASRRRLDNEVGLDGLADLANASRGTAFRIVGTATRAMHQVDREMAGYYLLSFRREPSDREGRTVSIEVRVARRGVLVRARTQFTPTDRLAAPSTVAGKLSDPRASIGELLRWPLSVREIGLDVDTYQIPIAETPSGIRAVIAAGVASGGKRLVALGWELNDEKGRTVADTFENPVVTLPLVADRQLYLGAVQVPAGTYLLKLAAIDEEGRRGSIEHTVIVEPWPTGPLRMSDVLIGEDSTAGFRPSPRLGPGLRAFTARVEIRGDTSEAFTGANVRLEVMSEDQQKTIAAVPLVFEETGDPLRRSAECLVTIDRLPQGSYVVRAVLETPSRRYDRLRTFRK